MYEDNEDEYVFLKEEVEEEQEEQEEQAKNSGEKGIENIINELKSNIKETLEKELSSIEDTTQRLQKWNMKALDNASSMLQTETTNLQKTLELNDRLTDRLIEELSLRKDEDDSEDDNTKAIIYKNIKNGVIQFSLQLIITVSLLLIILGGYHLIKLLI